MFGANVHYVPGMCLLGIGGTFYISHKIMAQKPNFHIFYFFSETTSRWCFIARRFPRPRPFQFGKIIVEQRHFGRTLKFEKCKNLVALRYYIQIVLGYV